MIALVVGVAVALAAVLVLVRGRDHASVAASPPAAPTAPAGATVSAVPSTTPAVAGGASPLRLAQGARRVNGVAVGYPHTQVGAVSAAVEYAAQVGSTLDPTRAIQIGTAVTDPVSGRRPAEFAEGPADSRRRLGLPVAGPVPAGASMTLGPVSYQIRDADADHVNVLLLGYLTVMTPAKGMRNLVGVFPVPLVWSGGDWKMVRRASDAPDYAELRFAPGSAQAVAAGWLPLTV
ncbi:hypothetical protein KRM28CT15_25450 [Krasilnikovia sp. M28-CT-15]